ncbi:hypothetical protein UNOSLW4_0025 [Pseudomonas phage UNO-SLW4]|uniref:Uncharacterized protein n=4 Tax=Pifdecavirus UNOSLW1 TaxID=2733661 RepID=A0A1B2AN08_9CAUD|nr:hypothetical protein HOS26_gp05 [Pseudomonas phage UNO-SLW1]ANY29020.1 hypothetical protein UNOSLW4_0025 [Pseudomonas phage UNO-SLW4]ANY29066.1 hypothetical protein UNOSLW3_0025 [Pseudomonas phage UNO-SLW3]ANY29113.1 hypothetical protein UNOSLW2_0025 [Pseudomonas phage UNO-SLW2]ANY29160.1 hypothetical protein UNOSLW1_0025 [Pseudomonas phage UNO-SLW1]
MISLNYTSFTSPQIAAKLLSAMHEVKTTGFAARLHNRKGDAFLLVCIEKDSLGYAFKFYDREGREVGKMIQKASQHWSQGDFAEYWSGLGFAWDLKEHPLTIAAREASERAHVDALKAHGATHKVITYGGAVVGYGAYQRDWLGRKRLYLVADKNGRHYGVAVKMTKEAVLMVARLEVLV